MVPLKYADGFSQCWVIISVNGCTVTSFRAEAGFTVASARYSVWDVGIVQGLFSHQKAGRTSP